MLQARRATRDDVENIDALIEPEILQCVRKFGKFKVANLIETSILAVVVVDDRDEVIGFASFLDSPPVGLQQGDLAQDKWPTWFDSTFRNDIFNVSNTAWLTFFIADPTYEKDAADRVLQTVFSTLAYLEGIIVVTPAGVEVFAPITYMFEGLPVTDPTYRGPKAYACPRSFFIPPLSIRAARIEDHDDLVPVFDQQSEVLTSIYGEFFLAELIESQNEHNFSLVAEVNDRAVGLMSITDEIDIRLLQKCFDLSGYDNLRKPREGGPEEEEEEEDVVAEPVSEIERRLGDVFQIFAGKGRIAVETEKVLSVLGLFVNGLDVAEGEDEDDEPAEGHNEDDSAEGGGDGDEEKVKEVKQKTPIAAAKEVYKEVEMAVAEDDVIDKERFVSLVNKFHASMDIYPQLLVSVIEFLEANAEEKKAEEEEEDEPESAPVSHRGPSSRRSGRGRLVVQDDQVEEPEDSEAIKSAKDNCFSITIFCLDEGFEARGINFLQPAFDLFPDREYCLLTLPHTAEESQLLTHFTKVPLAENNTFGHMLYLLHRDSVGSEIGVDFAADTDMPTIRDLVKRMSNGQNIIESVVAGMVMRKQHIEIEVAQAELKAKNREVVEHHQESAAFVVTCFGQVVGVVVADEQGFLDELQSDFAVEDYISFANLTNDSKEDKKDVLGEHLHANVRYFVLNPLFNSQVRFIFRECLRLFKKKVFYYKHYDANPLQDILDVFVQVRPRPKPVQSLYLTVHDYTPLPGADAATAIRLTDAQKQEIANAKQEKDEAKRQRDASLFSLHILTPRLNAQPKTTINARVVIVGASSTALAFLEALLLVPDLNYTNLTLVSPGGLPAGRLVTSTGAGTEEAGIEQFLPWSLHYDCNHMKQLAMQSRVRIITETLEDINCDHKNIMLSDGSLVAYDFLVLTPGLQDQTANRLRELDEELWDVEGVFSLSNEEQMPAIMDFIEIHRPSQYLVFGCSLTALTAIKGLMDMGVPMNTVFWAHPEAEESTSWSHGDKAVVDRVFTALSKLGVRVMPFAELLEVKHEDGRLTHVVLQNHEPDNVTAVGDTEVNVFTWECQCLIGCDTKDVDANIFNAVQKNSLVYDGRMVVDATFTTADVNVFAAGTFAKFSRKYGSSLPMEKYDPREIGQKLADSVLQQIDPASSAAYMEARSRYSPPQLGVVPRCEEAILPGPLYYFYAVQPSLLPVKKAKVIVTNHGDRLCRLVFDDNENLKLITYIGAERVETKNLLSLVGMPSSYMNRVLYRYANNQIPDLIAFLQEPWATALYHESFPDLRNELKAEVYERRDHLSGLLDRHLALQKRRKDGEPIDPLSVALLVNGMPQSVKEMIQIKLLHFLEFHANHLPGYQIPAVVPEPPGDR